MSPGLRTGIRWAAGLALVAASLWFMSGLLSLSVDKLRAEAARIRPGGAAAATALFAACLVAETGIWLYLLAAAPGRARLSFADAFAVLNFGALGKYLPGKVWGYAWQAYLLERRGVPVPASLWTGAVAFLASCAAGAITGAIAGALAGLSAPVVLAALLAGGALVAFVPLHERLGVADRLARRAGLDLGFAPLGTRAWAWAVLAYVPVWIAYGLAGVALAVGLEPDLGFTTGMGVIAAMTLSWLVGAVAFAAPGGLGVREAAMALALTELPGQLGVVLPIATRVLLVAVDVAFAATALAILWRRRAEAAAGGPKS